LTRAWGRRLFLRHTALALALAGCAHSNAAGSDVDTGYKWAVKSWTARAEIYTFADQRAHFIATVESRVFREQRVRERSRELGWPADVEQAESQKEFNDGEHETSFIVAAYTEVPRENDLGASGSIWRIALQTSSGELLPTRVDSLGRANENLQALYPYMDRFIRAYRIHFPKVSQGPVTLLIASGIGKAELKFENP
jgi:hypothetical protein